MSKKIIKASQKVARDTMEEKKRFHLYKSGKLWLVAGLATLSFATGELAAQAQTQSVHADVTTSKAATSSAASSATALKSSVAASSSATSAPASSAVTSSAASSATPSSATSSTAASDASSAASSSSSQASSSSSSEATSSASSKADTDQKSSAVNSSSATTAKSSAATSSSASTAKSSAANASSSATTAKSSAASTSSAAANSSSATKKTTSSAASSAASSKELNTKFHLDDVATIKQDGDELILDVAANKKLTDEQYQAIVDYATRNHLTVKGLSKQEQATHKTTASGEDLSGKFFATGSTKKGAAHDGDTITLDGDTITISLDSTKYHYLTKAETEALLDYIQSNNLKLVDNTVKSITTITFTDGTTGHSKTDGGHTKDDMLGYETRTSDPLVFLLGDTDVTGWNSIVIETSNGTDSTQSGNQRGQNTLFATGAYASHTYTAVVNGKVGAITIMSDAIVSIGEYSDTDSWFNIKNSDGSYANEKFVDAKDGNITAGKGPDGQYSKVILTDDQVQQLLRGMAYVANHPGTSITYNYSATEFNSENNGPDSEGRRGLDDFPVGSQKDFTGDIIVNVVDQDGNVIYSETDKANGGIANPKDATDAGLKDDSDDVKAKGSVDINDVLNNLFAGKNADGTEGTIKYIAGDGNEIWTDGTTTVEVSFTEAANGGVTVTYHVVDNTQASATVSYVDEDGNVISSEDVSGQVNSGVDYTVTPPDGWVIDSDKSPDYTAGETTSVKVTSDDSDNITIYVKHGTHEDTPTDPSDPNYDATHATSTETITYVNQDGDPMTGDEFATVTHTLDYTRTVIIDDVTGEVVGYGDWTPVDGDEFGAVTSPDKPGYTVDTDEVPAQGPTITNGTDGAVSDVNVTVTYTADDAEATVTYVDDDEDGAVVGDVTTKTGKTDGTVDVTISIPDGYEYVGTDGGVVSADGKTVTITFTADDADNIVIHLKHGTRNLTPDDPNYDEEASYNVIESIEYVDAKTGKKLKPNGSQTVSFTRDVVVDAVTGEVVSYGDWVADFGDTFPAYDAPTINGYFAGRQQVPESDAQVPGESEDFTEIIYYYSTEQTVEPTDPKNEGDKLGPSDPNSPTYPDGVSEDDLNQDVTETITYVNGENGKEIATTYTHTVHYTRNATITYNTDGTVAGIHYGDWVADDGESFPAIDSPVIAGYTPDQTSVDTQPDTTSQDKMPDINETVTYTADPAEATVTYVDDDKNGATVGDVTTVTGKTDGTTTVTVNIPDGYVYVELMVLFQMMARRSRSRLQLMILTTLWFI